MFNRFTSSCRAAVAAAAVFAIGCSAPADAPPPAGAAPADEAATAGPEDVQIVTGQTPVGTTGLRTIVMLEPHVPQEVPPPTSQPMMDQMNLTFVPDLLLVRTGQPVAFRNSENELHNVRVQEIATKEGTFNVALPTGGTYEHAFERDGFYDVGCDIHPGMSALVIASSTPYVTLADSSGHFSMADVTPGTYTAVMYAGGVRSERVVEVAAGRTELDLSGS